MTIRKERLGYVKTQYNRDQLAAESPQERQGRLQGSYEC